MERDDLSYDLDSIGFNRTYGLLSSRWKVYLICAIGNNTLRMGELKRLFSAISRVTLTRYLQELERDGFIRREVYPAPPLRVEYSLTEMGRSVLPILQQLLQWGAEY